MTGETPVPPLYPLSIRQSRPSGPILHVMIQRAGHYFFRTRNALFPALLLIMAVLFPPVAFGSITVNILAGVGLGMMILGQAIRVVTVGLDYIKRGGKNKKIYADRMVTGGFYAHSRNPMYAGNILIALGLLLLFGNPYAIVIGGAFVLFAYYSITRSEEAYLEDHFGDTYRAFVARTPRYLPRLRGLGATFRSYRFDWPGVVVKEYSTLFTTAMLATAVIAFKTYRTGAIDSAAPWLIGVGALWIVLFYTARYAKKGRNWRARGVTFHDLALPERRRRIDLLDAAILDLLNQRALEVSAVFDWKKANKVDRVDTNRMNDMLDHLADINQGPLSDQQVRTIFDQLIGHFAYHYERDEATAAPAASHPEPTEPNGASIHVAASSAATPAST